MMLLTRATFVLIFKLLLLISCINNSEKKKAEDQNDDRFSARNDRKEAQFLVDVIDKSYALLEVAQLGTDSLSDPEGKKIAKQLLDRQSKVSIRLKTFAEKNGVSIPFSGPENPKTKVKNLYDKDGKDFRTSWKDQASRMNADMKDILDDYRDKASAELKILLDSTIMLVEENNHTIQSLESVSN